MSSVNQSVNRSFNYSGFLQITVSSVDYKLQFIQDMGITFTDQRLDRDLIDTGSPVFTPVGDILGTFSGVIKNTVDMYDTVSPPTDQKTLSYLIYELANGRPPSVAFIQAFKAEEATTNKFARIRFTGRLTNIKTQKSREQGVEEAVFEGEIITFTSALRTAS